MRKIIATGSDGFSNMIKQGSPSMFVVPLSFSLLFIALISKDIVFGISVSWIAICVNLFTVALIFVVGSLSSRVIWKHQKKIMELYFLMFLTQIIGLSGNVDAQSFIYMAQIFLIFCYISYMTNIDFSNISIKVFNIFYTILCIISLLEYLVYHGNLWSKYMESGNNISGIYVFLTCINIAFVIMKKSQLKMLILPLMLVLPLMNTNSRTAIICALIIGICYLLLTVFRVRKYTSILLFFTVIIAVFGIVYLYPRIYLWSGYAELDAWSLEHFGKHILNTRDAIWMNTIDVVGGNWLFGLGTGLLNRDVMYYQGSSHNQYIQLYLQNGIVGLMLLFALFYTLWKTLSKHMEDNTVRFCLACFLGIIIFNCFETTLLQNKLVSGIIQWHLISIGVSRSLFIEEANA